MTKENPETIAEYKDALDTANAKINAQTVKITNLEKQLDTSTEAMTIIKKKFDSAETIEKDIVIEALIKDSHGKLTKEALKDHSLKDLYFLQESLAAAEPPSFVSVMRAREEDAKKPAPLGTVGTFNQETKKWEGGITE